MLSIRFLSVALLILLIVTASYWLKIDPRSPINQQIPVTYEDPDVQQMRLLSIHIQNTLNIKTSQFSLGKLEPLGAHTDKYLVRYTTTDSSHPSGFILAGADHNKPFIIPSAGGQTYCSWLETSNLSPENQRSIYPDCPHLK